MILLNIVYKLTDVRLLKRLETRMIIINN